MNILLDTHILLWTLSNDRRLPEKARELVENEENEIYYSIISLWEIEIKHLAHPDAMPVTAEEISGYCMQSGYQRLPDKLEPTFFLNPLSYCFEPVSQPALNTNPCYFCQFNAIYHKTCRECKNHQNARFIRLLVVFN